ncbi:MAG: type II toxin-antitoxin system VapC family toxin [Candidatus Eremiobacterota bacterium]
MKRYCLDTSGYSHLKRGRPEAVEVLDQADFIFVPSVVVGELWTGFLRGSRAEQNRQELLEFLSHPVVQEVPVDREVAIFYAELVDSLRRAGKPLPTNDIWIAAAAGCEGATVVTYDEHFLAIQRVPVLLLKADPV